MNCYFNFWPVVRIAGILISPSQNTQTTQAVWSLWPVNIPPCC